MHVSTRIYSLLIAALLGSVTLAQMRGPMDATAAILEAFHKYDVVAVNAGHENKLLDDFLLSLIQSPAFSQKLTTVVVECGNRRYQAILDRCISGDDVPLAEVQAAWRDTTVLMCGTSAFYYELFPLVRQLNRRLSPGRRVRVVAADPPVDWTANDPGTIRREAARDVSIATVMMTEVLAKDRKALMLFGTGHLYHNDRAGGSAVTTYERMYPNRTYVIDAYVGFGALIDQPRGRRLEQRMLEWPKPSVIAIKGTWLADLDLHYFLWPFLPRMAGMEYADLVDAYLYLGPADSLVYEKTPNAVLDDVGYVGELTRRFGFDPTEQRLRNTDPRYLTPSDRRWLATPHAGFGRDTV